MCVGAALSLEPDDPRSKELIRAFYTSGDLSKHFRRRRLSHISQASHGISLRCVVCDMRLTSKTHLQKHAMREVVIECKDVFGVDRRSRYGTQ